MEIKDNKKQITPIILKKVKVPMSVQLSFWTRSSFAAVAFMIS
jgi:hypothetical protein